MDILVPPKLPIDCVNVVLFILEFDTRYDGEISVTLALFLFSDCRWDHSNILFLLGFVNHSQIGEMFTLSYSKCLWYWQRSTIVVFLLVGVDVESLVVLVHSPPPFENRIRIILESSSSHLQTLDFLLNLVHTRDRFVTASWSCFGISTRCNFDYISELYSVMRQKWKKEW